MLRPDCILPDSPCPERTLRPISDTPYPTGLEDLAPPRTTSLSGDSYLLEQEQGICPVDTLVE